MTGKKVTGVDMVFVNTTRPAPEHVLRVEEGQELPADLRDGELDRLEKLGVFDTHPRDIRAQAVAQVSAAGGGLPVPQVELDAQIAVLATAENG